MSKQNFKSFTEWFKQSEYDYDTAISMFDSGRYIYTVFMCHLSAEKAMKGLAAKQLLKEPIKTHDLIFISNLLNLDLPKDLEDFIDYLNNLSVPTRYPDELASILKQYKKENTAQILKKTRELLLWLKEKLQK